MAGEPQTILFLSGPPNSLRKGEHKDQQPLQSFVVVFVNFVQSGILEAVESKSLTSRKACWSLNSL